MFDMATLQSAVTGLQTAGQIAKALHEVSASIEIKTKVIDLQAAILSAQNSALAAQSDQFAMIDRIRQLEKEIADVKAWKEEKQRYQLMKPWGGIPAFVYGLKESRKDTEPPHWICAKCYDDGRRTVLQPKKDSSAFILLCCPTCKSEMHSGLRALQQPTYAQG